MRPTRRPASLTRRRRVREGAGYPVVAGGAAGREMMTVAMEQILQTVLRRPRSPWLWNRTRAGECQWLLRGCLDGIPGCVRAERQKVLVELTSCG